LTGSPSLRASTFVLFYFLIYLFIYCFSEQLHNPPYRLLESPPALKHAPIKLAIYKLLCLAAKHRAHNLHA
jgi:hypothetical protein